MNDTPRNTDDAKGRVKEAAGDLTGDRDLKEEGKTDQAAGKLKDAADSLRLLLERNCRKAPVVENGSLVGIITQEDLFKLISLKSDLAA